MNNSSIEYLPRDDFEDAQGHGWHGAGWYFWDEADGQNCYGPYDSEGMAEIAMDGYFDELNRIDTDE